MRGDEDMSKLKQNHVIQKRNVLNEIRSNSMTLQELRFFSIYLSKIDKDRPDETRAVRFPLSDFQAIMELNSRVKIDYMKNVTAHLLRQIVSIRDETDGGYLQFQIFKRCRVSQDDVDEWYVEIDAHDDALPLMFEFKNKYFTYKLWNALRLKSTNQLRMYEILKQYQTAGYRILKVDDLKELLGIGKNEYSRFNDFKKCVIDICQEALAEHTDIKFTYEPYGKKGLGGKILQLKFIIEKNEKHDDPLALDDFIDIQKSTDSDDVIDVWSMDADDIDPDTLSRYEERLIFFRGAVGGEFTKEQMVVLCDLIAERMPQIFNDDTMCYDHIQRKYNKVKLKASRGEIRHSNFGYLKSIIGND